MMYRLEIPLHLSCCRIETNQRLREEIRAWPATAVIIAARCRCGQIEKTTGFIQCHRSPDVAMAVVSPRIVVPGVGARIACGLRDDGERPDSLARPGVDRLHISHRVRQLHTIWNLAAHNNE